MHESRGKIERVKDCAQNLPPRVYTNNKLTRPPRVYANNKLTRPPRVSRVACFSPANIGEFVYGACSLKVMVLVTTSSELMQKCAL